MGRISFAEDGGREPGRLGTALLELLLFILNLIRINILINFCSIKLLIALVPNFITWSQIVGSCRRVFSLLIRSPFNVWNCAAIYYQRIPWCSFNFTTLYFLSLTSGGWLSRFTFWSWLKLNILTLGIIIMILHHYG